MINSILRLIEIGLGYAFVPSGVKQDYELKLQFNELSQFAESAALSLIYSQENQKSIAANFIDRW